MVIPTVTTSNHRAEFRLEKIPTGTRLVITESGFDGIPADRRIEAHVTHNA